jgi:hypothetical protein
MTRGTLCAFPCREVGLLKINVERAEMDVLAGIQEQDWPKVRACRRQWMRHESVLRPGPGLFAELLL